MKTAIVATLGLSPPVVTSGIESIGGKITDLVMISTSDRVVQQGAELIRIALTERYPRMRFHNHVTQLEDIASTGDNFLFMSEAAKIIREEREVHHVDRLYLNVSGGRKNMCITLSLLGQLMGVDGVYHIVNRNVSIVNQRLEFLRHEIEMIAELESEEERRALYRRRKEEFESLLFPPAQDYEIIRIPTLPYPEAYIARLIRDLKTDMDMISEEDKKKLVKCGILEKGGRNYYFTDYGNEFLRVLLG